jgi:hypothetical protein
MQETHPQISQIAQIPSFDLRNLRNLRIAHFSSRISASAGIFDFNSWFGLGNAIFTR